MRRWIPIAVLVAAACKPTETPKSNTPEPTNTTAATEPVDTQAVAGTAGAMTAATDPNNILGLDLPKFEKGTNWQYGVPAPKPFPATFDPSKDYFAKIKTTIGDITVKFYPDLAPRHVTSFIYLSQIGYYEGAPFHRIIGGFMMQGGDPSGQGNAGPAYKVPAEFTTKKKHTRGILSMARTPDPNSAGSQFFVMFAPAPSLDGQYTIFGEVVEGMDVVAKFEALADPKARNGVPPKKIEKIKTVEVFTKEKK